MEGKWVSQEVCEEKHRLLEIFINNNKAKLTRMDSELRDIQEALVRLTILMERHDLENQDHENRLRSMEAKPGKRWDNLMVQITSLLAAAAVGGFLGSAF